MEPKGYQFKGRQGQLKNHRNELSGGGDHYDVQYILGRPTLNIMKAVVALYLLLIQFELDDGKVEKIIRRLEDGKGMLLCKFEILRTKADPPTSKSSRPNKTEWKVVVCLRKRKACFTLT